jgi:dTDP-4-amino-4,6-dideoxygalactose transaminase
MKQLAFANPAAQLRVHRAAIDAAMDAVFESGHYIQGKAHDAFEQAFAAYIGATDAVGCGNGTDALVLALRAGGVGHGHKVVAPAHTAAATISAIRLTGATPIFVDVDPVTALMTPEIVEAALTPEVKAVVLVHLYGNPADVHAVRKLCDTRGIFLVEDCAQATGATCRDQRVGSIGHVGTFSFFPTKNLGAIGDGGMVTTQDSAIAGKLRALRTYGWDKDRLCQVDGMNSRLDELQAAILGVKLPFLDRDNARRRVIAGRYNSGLRDLAIDLPQANANGEHVYHLYVIALDARDEMQAYLKVHGIIAGIHYQVPNHLHPVFKQYAASGLPVTERLARRILSLPIYPELSDAEADRVVDAVRGFFDERR